MNRSLWLLLMLTWKGKLRRTLRGLRSPRRAILTLVGLGMITLWLVPAMMLPHQPADPETLRRFVPLGMLGYCLLAALLSAGEPAISLSGRGGAVPLPGAAEPAVAAGLQDREQRDGVAVAALFISLWWHRYAAWSLASIAAGALAINFTQLFAMALALGAGTIGKRAYSRVRKVLVGLLAAAVIALGAMAWQEGAMSVGGALRIVESPIVSAAIWPLRPFAEVFIANAWPDLLRWSALALVVDGAIAAIVMLLDAQYMEAFDRCIGETVRAAAGGAQRERRRGK